MGLINNKKKKAYCIFQRMERMETQSPMKTEFRERR